MNSIRSFRPERAGWIWGLLLAGLAGGCTGQMAAFKLSSHDPRQASTIMVLPFLDSRTFRPPEKDATVAPAESARAIFVEAMKSLPEFQGKNIVTPNLERPPESLTQAQILDQGRQFGADLVIAAHLFSYTEVRAASIPPRAGLFVRVFSVPDNRLVFVGDHYLSGSSGGREEQARRVALTILQNYLAAAPARPAGAENGAKFITAVTESHGPKVLLLPYHDRPNPNNPTEQTGGGAVVTALLQMELLQTGQVEVIEPQGENVSHAQLLTPAEALEQARQQGAAYVIRGEVVEFSRAMSVPSLASAVVSVWLLGAQLIMAETCGVDIATEVWRVEDGKCIFAKRDTSIQKYVVQAEQTVRKLLQQTAPELVRAALATSLRETAPLIDTIAVKRRATAGRHQGAAPAGEGGPGEAAPATGRTEAAGTEAPAAAAGEPEKKAPAAESARRETERAAGQKEVRAARRRAAEAKTEPTEEGPTGRYRIELSPELTAAGNGEAARRGKAKSWDEQDRTNPEGFIVTEVSCKPGEGGLEIEVAVENDSSHRPLSCHYVGADKKLTIDGETYAALDLPQAIRAAVAHYLRYFSLYSR